MRALLVAFVSVALATPASAFCSRGFGYDFESQINAEFKYLICIHNEQNDALNNHSRLINDHADALNIQRASINDLIDRNNEMRQALLSLSSEVRNLAQSNELLEDRISSIEARLYSLEN
ncbi:hypothetical protein [uncultured Litoreibacter sp.]|uniref:hypothetical protein n=1 Tax=uncultured Litoreibacter sp. TaxID=1392394 RepID=UPI002631C76A|nr:hypothetical protein [uncultured Litoreibacter sp.]